MDTDQGYSVDRLTAAGARNDSGTRQRPGSDGAAPAAPPDPGPALVLGGLGRVDVERLR
jgi:hypothetical protein